MSDAARVRALLGAGEGRRALAVSAQLVETAPGDPELLSLQAASLEATGAWERAVLVRREVSERRPDDPEALLALARAQIATGDGAGALATLDGAGEDAARLDLRARALTLAGDLDGAVALRSRLATDGDGRAELARALARAGAAAEAEALGVDDLEVAARRAGAAGMDAWWARAADAGTLTAEVVVLDLRDAAAAGRPKELLERFARLGTPPAAAALVPLVAGAVATLAGRPGDGLREALAGAVRTPAGFWSRVVDHLIRDGAFDAGRALVAALPGGVQADRLRARLSPILAALPSEADVPAELRVDPARRAQIVAFRRPRPEGTMVILGVRASRLLHVPLAARGFDLVHLSDPRDLNFLGGLPELGADWASTVPALARLVEDPGPRGLFTAGTSGPGYAAVRLGVDLGATGVLALGPPTILTEDTIRTDGWGGMALERVARDAPELLGDLRTVLLSAPAPPRVHVWHAAEHVRDTRHAERLDGVPSVTRHAVPGVRRHNVLLDMLERGMLDGALDELLGATAS